MKFLFNCFLILNIIGCSTNLGHRKIASTDSLSAQELLTFKRGAPLENDQQQDLMRYLNGKKIQAKIEFNIHEMMEDGTSTMMTIKPDFIEGKNVLVIHAKAGAFKDQNVVSRLHLLLNNILFSEMNEFNGNHAQNLWEIYQNAQANDPRALLALISVTHELWQKTPVPNTLYGLTQGLLDELKKEKETLLPLLEPKIVALKKEIKIKKEARKAIADVLDKASDDQQLKALIAKNDRQGASQLLRQYLPFEEMAPFEKRYWENYLEAMANPVPYDQRILLYRGIDDDFIHSGIKNGVALSKEAAIQESNAFVMSTMLVKNQGSWNRRLRSLESMYEKYIGLANRNQKKETFEGVERITIMMKNHSREPKGSPFLSFTPNRNVALRFGSRINSLYLIDPRLVTFNSTSRYDSEIEFLMPLFTFPDDLVAIRTKLPEGSPEGYNYHYLEMYENSYFYEKLREKLAKTYGANPDEILDQVNANSSQFFNWYFRFDPLIAPQKEGKIANCQEMMARFWVFIK